jgi:hypothetical protein
MDAVGAGTFGKPLLVELSRAVERFALATDAGGAAVVVAMFQEAAYFRSGAEVYRAIAATGAVTVVGFVGDAPPLPPGVRHVLLSDGDDLVKEWSVTVLWPYGGATPVAADLQTLEPGALTAEEGRTFRAGWSFRREEARRQVLRLRATLPLGAATAADVDAVVRAVAATPEPVHQRRGTRRCGSSPTACTSPSATARRSPHGSTRPPTRPSATRRPASTPRPPCTAGSRGRAPRRSAWRWCSWSGSPTCAQYGRRAELAVLATAGAALGDLIGEGHRVVAQGPEELLVVLPGATPDDVLRLCNEVAGLTSRLGTTYPFVALPVKVAGTVTRAQPLPVARLQQQVTAGHRAELVPG